MNPLSTPPCPEPEVLAAFVDGYASVQEIQVVLEHITTCSKCVESIGETVNVKRLLGERARHPNRGYARYVAAAAIVVAACSIMLALRAWKARDPMSRLVAAAEAVPFRPVEGRLSGFPYDPAGPVNRGQQHPPATLHRLRATAGEILEKLPRETPDDAHIAGIAALLAGNPKALELLSAATDRDPGDARAWNDLAVARLSAALEQDEPQTLVLALAAADRAIRSDPALVEPRFNRALILEKIGLERAAMRAFSDYVARDSESPWASEASARIVALRKSVREDTWKTRIAALERAALAKDDRAVLAIIAEYPQEARTHGEAVVLANWGGASGKAAGQQLEIADAIARALIKRNGESLLSDAVSTIRRERDPARISRLAAAHQTYLSAGTLYGQRRIEESLPLFLDCDQAFRETGSPMAGMTGYYIASCAYDMQKTDEALAGLDALLRSTPERHRALRALLLWENSTALQRNGALLEALDASRRSLELFTALGEELNANTMHNAVASNLALVGRRVEAWRQRQTSFRRISATGDTINLQRAVDASARTEALDERWDEALSLFAVALEPGMNANPRLHVASLLWHALAAQRLGLEQVAEHDIAAGRIAIATIPAGKLRDRAAAELTLIEASVVRNREPERAQALLNKYVADARATGTALLLPEVLLERARAYRATERNDLAEADLRESLRLLGERSPASRPEVLREGYFRTRETATRELVDMLEAADADAAFAAADESRSLAYAVDARRAASTSDTTVLEYVVLPDRLIVFAADSRGVRTYRSKVTADELARLCDAFVESIRHDGRGTVGPTLARILLGPAASEIQHAARIVVVPDGPITNVPFAALPLPDGSGYLVERHEIVVAPSAAVAWRAGRGPVAPRDLSVAAIGNPRFSHKYFPSLENLPAAEQEAVRVARLYPRTRVLIGSDATREAVLAALNGADIVDIAGHGITVNGDPARSHLVLAEVPDHSGALYLNEIVRTKQHQLVVLAGCRTGEAPEGQRNVPTFALAFLAAGAANVLGTLWNVEDETTTRMAIAFHQRLTEGVSPATALRDAQLTMIRSNNPRLRLGSTWSALQLYGSGNW